MKDGQESHMTASSALKAIKSDSWGGAVPVVAQGLGHEFTTFSLGRRDKVQINTLAVWLSSKINGSIQNNREFASHQVCHPETIDTVRCQSLRDLRGTYAK